MLMNEKQRHLWIWKPHASIRNSLSELINVDIVMQEQLQLQLLPRSSCSQKTVSWYLFSNGCVLAILTTISIRRRGRQIVGRVRGKEEGERGNERAFPFKNSAVHAYCLQKQRVQTSREEPVDYKPKTERNAVTRFPVSKTLNSLCSGESSLVHKDGACGPGLIRKIESVTVPMPLAKPPVSSPGQTVLVMQQERRQLSICWPCC